MFNKLLSSDFKKSINSFFKKPNNTSDELLNELASAVILVEQDFKDVTNTLEAKIKKEKMFINLIRISGLLIKYRLDNSKLNQAFIDIMTLLKVNSVHLIKHKNDDYNCVKCWYKDIKDKAFFDNIVEKDFYIKFEKENKENSVDFYKCYRGDKADGCFFPIIVNDCLWGTLGFLRHKNTIDELDINHIYFCGILASIISSHIKTYKLIDNLKQQSNIVDIVTNLVNVYAWAKDENRKYLWCSSGWKKSFFNLNENDQIQGLTDTDLLKQNDDENCAFSYIGDISDDCCKTSNNTCYFIESCYINNNKFFMGVEKTPLYIDKRYRGIAGIATKINNPDKVVKALNSYGDDVKKLYFDSVYDDTFVYQIKSIKVYNKILSEGNTLNNGR